MAIKIKSSTTTANQRVNASTSQQQQGASATSTMTSVMGISNKNEFIVGGKYRLMRKIGSGSFGDIYLGINVSNGEVNLSLV